MRKISKPNEVAEDVYLTCVSMVKNANLKLRLTAASHLISAASTELDSKLTTGTVNTIIRETKVNCNLSKKELEKVYTLRMAKKGATGRKLYDKILVSSHLGLCPFCAHRDTDTIDHYLPKTQYPRLVVTPINLIPCCSVCNDIKDAFYPLLPNQQFIHPYYDDIEREFWLSAVINQTVPCTIKYSVTPPLIWPDLLKERVAFQFGKLKLALLYSVQAARTLAMMQGQLTDLFNTLGSVGVRNHLIDCEKSVSRIDKNSWQAVFYRAAMNDDWFCNGGFK